MARFDLYERRKNWWFYYYLALAACKGTKEYEILAEMVFDAVSYEDNYEDILERIRVKTKYNVKSSTK